MTIRECYQQLGGNYDAVLSRFRSEERVRKFVLRFLDDKSYQLLIDSLQDQNYDEAFRAAHTIKGICQNLGLDQLFFSSNELTEQLRNKDLEDLNIKVSQVERDYKITIEAIEALVKEKTCE